MPAVTATRPVFRFAPSPNGRLHLGHAYSALLNQQIADWSGGILLLRMEDIDRDRCRREFETAIIEDLAWLGVHWDPAVIRQSERFDLYAAVLADLERQTLVYPCFCTRGDLARVVGGRADWPRDPDGAPLYPGTCRGLTAADRALRFEAGQRAGVRLDMAAALRLRPERLDWLEFDEGRTGQRTVATPSAWGDALLARKDVPASYHLAVIVDDAAQGVTDVVRGEDLRPATSLHRLLQTLIGLPAPAYHHHRLVLDETGRKLSKSRAAPALAVLRAGGATPAAVHGMLGLGPA